MEKTKKVHGDFADDVLPEKSVDLGHYVVASHFINLSSLVGWGSYSKVLTPTTSTFKGYYQTNEQFQIEQLKDNKMNGSYSDIQETLENDDMRFTISEMNLQKQKHNGKKTLNSSRGSNQNIIVMNKSPLPSASLQMESQANISIADERKNAEPAIPIGETPVLLVYSKRVHSMAEKKNRLKVVDFEGAEQQTEFECMSESSPQLIPKFSYRVSMPQNLSREKQLEQISRSNENRYLELKSTVTKLIDNTAYNGIIPNFIQFLNNSYLISKDKPEECAHLLLTLETQFDLLLAISLKGDNYNSDCYSNSRSINRSYNNQYDSQSFSFKDQEDPGDEGVI